MVLLPYDYDKYLFTCYGHRHVFISSKSNLTDGCTFQMYISSKSNMSLHHISFMEDSWFVLQRNLLICSIGVFYLNFVSGMRNK